MIISEKKRGGHVILQKNDFWKHMKTWMLNDRGKKEKNHCFMYRENLA